MNKSLVPEWPTFTDVYSFTVSYTFIIHFTHFFSSEKQIQIHNSQSLSLVIFVPEKITSFFIIIVIMGEILIWHELWYKNTDHNDSEDFLYTFHVVF